MHRERFCQWCESAAHRGANGWFGHYVNVAGELVHVVEAGTGMPVILLHGFLAWSYTWRLAIPTLQQQARVIAPDLRGFGFTERGRHRGHSLSDQADLVRSLMDSLEIDEAVVCGHSMGGEIAMRLALRAPERVKALVLVSSAGLLQRVERPAERLLRRLPGINHLALKAILMNRRFAAQTMRSAYRAPEAVSDPDIAAYLLPSEVPGTTAAFWSFVRDMDFGAGGYQWSDIAQPSLIIWGENDPWIPLDHGRRLARELPNTQLMILPECGHVPPEEQPDAFVASVCGFLASL